jgi:MFS family permease
LPWVVATALFMEQLDSTIVNTAVPSMAASLHVTPLSLKAVAASYILSLAVCIPVSGWTPIDTARGACLPSPLRSLRFPRCFAGSP